MQNMFIELLPPWIETGLQPAFYDKESGTVLQQVSRMWAKMIELGQGFNTFSTNVTNTVNSYITQFNDLYTYVHDYFDNLDVQEEINNKLDDMAEDGTLQEIITAYVQSNVTWTFDTVAEMKTATNLIEGSYAQTVGYYTAGDNGASKYIIKSSSTGVHETLDSGLVAELIEDDSKVEYIFPKGWDNPSGNGDISLIKAYGKNILIDTYRTSNYSDVETFLTTHGVSHIDYLILSHYHDDHVGNFENLLNDHYIDDDTHIYLPAYSSLMSASAVEFYNAIATLISNHQLDAEVPTEGSTLSLGSSFKITFYNCETSIFTTAGYTDYNDCSTVCLVEHGDSKALFTGDCTVKASNRLIDEGLVNTSVNLYKLSHHGINDGVANTFRRFINVINPDYAVQLSSLNDAEKGKYSISSQLYYLQSVGSKIYTSYKNTDDMLFESNVSTISASDGISTDCISNVVSETNLYVDVSTTNDIQNGTQEYPFKEIAQALGECGKTPSRYVIHMADGSYNTSNHINLNIENSDIEIVGNTTDNTKVVIYSPLNINESSVKISYCTVSNESGSISLYANSSLIIDHCLITNLTTKAGNGIWTQDLKSNTIEATTSTFKDLDTGISAKYCNVAIYTTTFNNVTTAMNLQRCKVIEKANTYTSVTTKINYNTYTTSLLPNQRVLLATGIDVMTGTITISDSIRNYNKLLIISGYTGDGTVMGSTCYSYGDDKFNNGTTYNAKSINDDIFITPSNNTTLTITRSSGTPDKGIRKIYGYIENTI